MTTNGKDMDEHAADFRKTASALGHNVEDLGSITKELAGDAVGKVQNNAVKYYDQGMDKARSHPLASLLIAAGIGLVAGALFKRR